MTALGGLPTFANLVTNSETRPNAIISLPRVSDQSPLSQGSGAICKPLGSTGVPLISRARSPGIGTSAGGYFAVASARLSPFGPAAEHSPHFGGASQIVLRSWFA